MKKYRNFAEIVEGDSIERIERYSKVAKTFVSKLVSTIATVLADFGDYIINYYDNISHSHNIKKNGSHFAKG